MFEGKDECTLWCIGVLEARAYLGLRWIWVVIGAAAKGRSSARAFAATLGLHPKRSKSCGSTVQGFQEQAGNPAGTEISREGTLCGAVELSSQAHHRNCANRQALGGIKSQQVQFLFCFVTDAFSKDSRHATSHTSKLRGVLFDGGRKALLPFPLSWATTIGSHPDVFFASLRHLQ